MEILRHAVLLVHLSGFAILFGAGAVTALMNWGLLIAGVAGLALAAPWGVPEGVEFNYMKIGTKLVILLIIGALLGIGSARTKRNGSAPAGVFWAIGILTFVNAAIATLWR
jgi:hypothetical protein